MNEPWEEALDLDDSDLSSLQLFKRRNHHKNAAAAAAANISLSWPFLRRCAVTSQSSQTVLSQNPQSAQNILSQLNPQPPPSNPPLSDISPRLIPGPAGTVQAAMHRRQNQNNEILVGLGEEPIPTQEYIRRAAEGRYAAKDEDFGRDPWLFAVDFIRREGLALESDGAIGIPLSAIKGGGVNLDDKVAQVVAIVKSCKPNGLGDMMLTLKDPTATIDASVHRKVLTEIEFGKEISVGAVIILRNVSVFSPSRFVHCLNITVRNVVKVISIDNVTAILKQSRPASASTNKLGSGSIETPSHGITEGILNSLRQSASMENNESGKNEEQMAKGVNHNFAAEKEGLSVRENVEGHGDDQEDVASEELKSGRGNVAEGVKGESAEADIVDVHSWKESGKIGGIKQQHQGSKASLLQWTDEQLDELFASD